MSARSYVTADQLLNTTYGMLAMTSAVVVARTALQVTRRSRMAAEDYLIYLSYAMYISMTVMYIVATPAMFRITDFAEGRIAPYSGVKDDVLFLTRIFFANAMIFWFVLWGVKFSLLALYRRLLFGLADGYLKMWWAVFIFCVLTLIGAVVSNFTSCHSWHAWWTPGECSTPGDVRAQITSLWYAYAVDVLTDMMIMFLPLRLVYNIKLPRGRKISVMSLFSSGFICILFATLRVVQIGQKAGNNTTPSSSWLALWAMVESSIAIVIGCCPALYRKTRKQESSSSYNLSVYLSPERRSTNVGMENFSESSHGSRRDPYWEVVNGSQEELAMKGIVITKSVQQNVVQSS